MSLRKLVSTIGKETAEIETILDDPATRPGGRVSGTVHLSGGEIEQEIDSVRVGLLARVEVEVGDHEGVQDVQFAGEEVADDLELKPGARHELPFTLEVPWEMPITTIGGQHLRGMQLGVHTDVDIESGRDKGDLDPITVHPLPAQERVLEALTELGFRFRHADLERGRMRGVDQALPFYQEIEFLPAPQHARGMSQLEVTFVAGPRSMEVVLELDKRGGLLTEGHDAFGRFTVQYDGVERTDWPSQLDGWLSEASRRRGIL